MANYLSSERFIELFITIKQMRHLKDNNASNLYNAEWSFNITTLKEFIFHSKKDYRYKDFLQSFDFVLVNGTEYSINLAIALNRAMSKHMLTGIYEYVAYISRHYINHRILEESSEFYNLMNEFINDFEYFCLDKKTYLQNSEYFTENSSLNTNDNTRMIFDLQRRIIKKYEDKE